jgi:UPF0755 protein
MIDELDVAFDEHAEKGRPRHRRGARQKKSSGRSAVAFLMIFVLLGLLGGGAWYGYGKVKGFFTAADYDGPGTDEVVVKIKDKSTITDIGNELVKVDVIKSTKAFIEASDKNAKSRNIREGSYKMRKQMSAADALTLMLDPKARVVGDGVTIPEGKTSKEVFAILSKASGVPVKDFELAAKDPEALGVPEFWYTRDDGQKVTKSIEGFLFPDTYEFDKGATAADQLKKMVKQFMAVTTDLNFVDDSQSKRKITPYEVLTVASLAQAEAGNKDDLGKIARVAYNRVYNKDWPCQCLQFDVGINYYYQLTGRPIKASKNMSAQELRDPKNPYRTHDKPGLTPTPINNPGKDALAGALSPPPGNWTYFVAIDKQGHSAFANNAADHEKNKQLAIKNGVL